MNAQPDVQVHLNRVVSFLDEADDSTAQFREKLQAHHDALGKGSVSFEDFLFDFVEGAARGVSLKKDKAALVSDLDLATRELELGEMQDRDATVTVEGDGKDVTLTIPQLRAAILRQRGFIELLLGSNQQAEQYFLQSVERLESPEPYYMLGAIAEAEYRPVDALNYYEKSIQLEPAGVWSVGALRGAESMKNYKKKFRGSWGIFCALLLIWPAAVVYFFAKRK